MAAFVYGAGLDWTLHPHLGLRFQYRGNLYEPAHLTDAFTSTNALTQAAEPVVAPFPASEIVSNSAPKCALGLQK